MVIEVASFVTLDVERRNCLCRALEYEHGDVAAHRILQNGLRTVKNRKLELQHAIGLGSALRTGAAKKAISLADDTATSRRSSKCEGPSLKHHRNLRRRV